MEEIYIITGGSGHLGNVLARILVERNQRVWLFLNIKKNVVEGVEKIYYGDVSEKASLQPIFEDARGYKVIFIHCAGIISIKSEFSQRLYDVNVGGTRNIVDLCEHYGVNKLVYISSVHAIPDNTHGEVIAETGSFDAQKVIGHYAKSKSKATEYVLDAGTRGLNVNVIHPSGIIGPSDFGRGHMTTMITDYCEGKLVAATEGGFDFVDVRDVAEGIIACAVKGSPGECYLLTNRYYTIRELMDMLCQITGRKKVSLYLPLWLIKPTAHTAEFFSRMLKKPPIYTWYSLHTLSTNNHYSHKKATEELGYETRDMDKTLKDTFDWLVEKGRIR